MLSLSGLPPSFRPERWVPYESQRAALQAELSLAPADADTAASPAASLDLSQPLALIEREIVRMVLEKSGDNQSRAAQSLGISRTTLWRMLKA